MFENDYNYMLITLIILIYFILKNIIFNNKNILIENRISIRFQIIPIITM